MSFFGELRRRHVFRVGAGYAVVAWLLIQVAGAILPTFSAPLWVLQTVTLLLILGFPLSLVIAWAFDLTPEGIKRTLIDSDVSDGGQRALLETTGSGELRGPAPSARSAPSRLTLKSPDSGRLRNSVAVLPFANLSPNPDDAYFAAGLHDELLNQLAKISALNVIARTSVLQYEGARRPVAEIAHELNVETIMEGSVRFARDRVRVTTQLIEAASGTHLWSETYERPFDDIFAIESDIAINVATAMKAKFSPAEQRAIEKIPTESAAAYGLYLQARNILFTGAGESDHAHGLLDRAIEIDPQFARAHGLQAMIHGASFANTAQSEGVGPEGREALERQVRSHAERALAIDPKDPDARAALRTLSILTWHWSEFDQHLEPGDENSLASFGLWFYSWRGQRDYAVRLGERIAELNPNDVGAHLSLAIVYAYAGNRAASSRTFRRMMEVIPDSPLAHIWLAFNEIALGNRERALEELRLVEKLLGNHRHIVFLPDLAYCYAQIGRPEDAERVMREIETLGSGVDLGAGTWATAYLAIGDEKQALEQLERVAAKARNHESDQGFLNVMSLRMNHLADPTLEKPEFVDVFSRITGD
jgi:TolB-like protein